MVQMVDPDLGDTVYDPACGTAGFLIDVVDHLLARYSEHPIEVPIYGEDWLEKRGQTLAEARKEIPALQTYRKGPGEKNPGLGPARSWHPRQRRLSPAHANRRNESGAPRHSPRKPKARPTYSPR